MDKCLLLKLGINVDYSVSLCGQQMGNAVIRHLILCWSGDHVGQCEVGKIIKCGKCPCRRCKLKGLTYRYCFR